MNETEGESQKKLLIAEIEKWRMSGKDECIEI